MKKLLGSSLALLLGLVIYTYAANESAEAPIQVHTDPISVSVSSSVYTNVTPSSVQLDRQTAILLDVPSTNSAAMHGHIGDCSSTSISTFTVLGPVEIHPSSGGGSVSLAQGECLWMVSRLTTGPEDITVQGISQHR